MSNNKDKLWRWIGRESCGHGTQAQTVENHYWVRWNVHCFGQKHCAGKIIIVMRKV